MDCKKCGSDNTIKHGKRVRSGGDKVQRWKCKECGHIFDGEEIEGD